MAMMVDTITGSGRSSTTAALGATPLMMSLYSPSACTTELPLPVGMMRIVPGHALTVERVALLDHGTGRRVAEREAERVPREQRGALAGALADAAAGEREGAWSGHQWTSPVMAASTACGSGRTA